MYSTGGKNQHNKRSTHSSLIAGHFGVGKTVAHLQRYCYWPKMNESVSRYVRGCSLCATRKPSNRKLGLYTPLPVPSRPWESISMDFVGGLPMSRKIMIIFMLWLIDFSKMCILMPCKKQVTAEQTGTNVLSKCLGAFWIAYFHYF
jgi:hypothetical protein